MRDKDHTFQDRRTPVVDVIQIVSFLDVFKS